MYRLAGAFQGLILLFVYSDWIPNNSPMHTTYECGIPLLFWLKVNFTVLLFIFGISYLRFKSKLEAEKKGIKL